MYYSHLFAARKVTTSHSGKICVGTVSGARGYTGLPFSRKFPDYQEISGILEKQFLKKFGNYTTFKEFPVNVRKSKKINENPRKLIVYKNKESIMKIFNTFWTLDSVV